MLMRTVVGEQLERLERSFLEATTVTVMNIVGFQSGGSGEDEHVVTNLQIEYVFKESPASYPPYRGRGAYSKKADFDQVVTSCDVELAEAQLVIAFANEHGEVRFGGCYPESGPINFNLLPHLYELKAIKAGKPAGGT